MSKKLYAQAEMIKKKKDDKEKIKKIAEMEQSNEMGLDLLENVVIKLRERIELLEEHVKKLDEMFATMIRMSNPVSRPKYRSGEWHIRSGNVMQNAALPDSPNAEKIEPTASAETADDPGGHLPPLE